LTDNVDGKAKRLARLGGGHACEFSHFDERSRRFVFRGERAEGIIPKGPGPIALLLRSQATSRLTIPAVTPPAL
jgi:hypothetical protein